jgi:hypothetical protein
MYILCTCLLQNYNSKTDFVIDLDDIWNWLGFCQKHNAKSLLEKNFSIDIDYINLAPEASGARKHGGNNKIKIMLTVKTFKSINLYIYSKFIYIFDLLF